MTAEFERFDTNPLVSADDAGLEGNVNGPAVIRAPEWLPRRLGKYYMYFAHHQGKSIRLAYADALEGPWTIYEPGTLHLEQTPCSDHIASPDVHVLEERRLIRMYYHGPALPPSALSDDPLFLQFPYLGGQRTLVAHSTDGLSFETERGILGSSYFRCFQWRGQTYAVGMPGILYRQTGESPVTFEQGPLLFDESCRHFAVRVAPDSHLECFFTRAGDMPERILLSRLDLNPPWTKWKAKVPVEVLQPERGYEGAGLPLVPSARGAVHVPARQLRDPCVFEEGDQLYLFYAAAGEHCLAGARQIA